MTGWMLKALPILAMASACPPALALDCAAPETSGDVAACLELELRDSDRMINETYQALRGKLDEPGKLRLRDEQRAWLKKRDSACELDTKETDRERWMRSILSDYKKTVCVVRFTRARETQLQALLAASSVPADDAEQDALADNARYEAYSDNAHRTGKWYFEVQIDPTEIAAHAETALWIGFNSSYGSTGRLINVRKRDSSRTPIRLGFALDLDNGEFYQRDQGAWSVQPGSAAGFDVKTGQSYRAEVTSSVAMGPLLDRRLIQINFGDRPFADPLPEGYRPFSAR